MSVLRVSKKLMGSAFELLLKDEDQTFNFTMSELAFNEIERLESLLSEFRESSETSDINRNAGIRPVRVSNEVFELIRRSRSISVLSRGMFDISVGPLKKLYKFKNTDDYFPERKLIEETMDLVGYRHIELDESNQTVFLKRKGMHISFAAIGKGYAADRVKAIWRSKGLQSGMISAAGDISALGESEIGKPWQIGISDPDNIAQNLFFIPVKNTNIATSGNYFQFIESKGRRYSHNINPVTGLPVHDIKSVSVLSPSAELSDALATSVTAMGAENGISFIDQLPDTHCVIIDHKNKIHMSKNIQINAV